MSTTITMRDHRESHGHEFPNQAGGRWRLGLWLGLLGLGLFLLATPREKEPLPTGKRVNSVTAQPSGAPRSPLGAAGSRFAQGRSPADPGVAAAWPAGGGLGSAPQALPRSLPRAIPRSRHLWELDELVSQFQTTKQFTPAGAEEMKRLLGDLRGRGAAAVPAIGEFLRSQFDVDYRQLSGGDQAEQATLRLALLEVLRQIGGEEAIRVSLEQLRTTLSPAEIAVLASYLEEAAPGLYRDEALRAANYALQTLAMSKDALDVRPLFETLRMLGGMEAVSTLHQLPANASRVEYLLNRNATHILPAVQTYALITLAGLPDGEGVADLVALAADPGVPVELRTAQPFQMLAQASADQARAGEKLVELARAREIPEAAWSAIADALAGKHLQFPSEGAGGTSPARNEANGSGVEAPFSRGFYDDDHNLLYEERIVANGWSVEQVQRRRTLIDNLLAVTKSPVARRALEQARAALPGIGV